MHKNAKNTSSNFEDTEKPPGEVQFNSFGEESFDSATEKVQNYADFDFTPEQKRAFKQELLKARMMPQHEKSRKGVKSYANIENF